MEKRYEIIQTEKGLIAFDEKKSTRTTWHFIASSFPLEGVPLLPAIDSSLPSLKGAELFEQVGKDLGRHISSDDMNLYLAGYKEGAKKQYSEEDIRNILYDYDKVDWSKREHKPNEIMMMEWLKEKLQSLSPKPIAVVLEVNDPTPQEVRKTSTYIDKNGIKTLDITLTPKVNNNTVIVKKWIYG